MRETQFPVSLSICVDCLFFLANGVENDETERAAKRITRKWSATNITLGKLHDECEHPDTDEDRTDCESLGFSWYSCDGCGSGLGGDRYAATAWVSGLQCWEAHLYNGRGHALYMARHALKVSQFVRETRGYGWRAVCASRIAEAGKLRRAVQAGRVQG